MKKLLIGLLTAASLIVPAHAAGQFYESDPGVWKVIGWQDAGDPNFACVAKTFWRDGGQINVNVWDQVNNEDYYTTMTVYMPNVTTDGMQKGVDYEFDLAFIDEGERTLYTMTVQRYGEKVILRNLGGEFFRNFADSEKMILFVDTSFELVVGLEGTRRAVQDLEECLSIGNGEH
jgi:hypothetical protein